MDEFWFSRGATQAHRHHAAMVEVTSYGPIQLSRYSGPIGNSALKRLRQLAAPAVDAVITVQRLDFALLMVDSDGLAVDQELDPHLVPSAIVVADDQFDLWDLYSDRMLEAGIKRVVFRRSQIWHCQDWVFSMLQHQHQKQSSCTL